MPSPTIEPTSKRPSRIRRAPWQSLILFLLLGAIVNVLLTWCLCITMQLMPARAMNSVTHFDSDSKAWPYALSHDNSKPDQANRVTAPTYTMDTGTWGSPPHSSSNDWAITIVNEGLPFRSFRYCYEINLHYGQYRRMAPVGGWQFLHTRIFDSTLPLLPIWPGFLLNTLLYAALLWLPIRGPDTIRRTLRRRRGQCLACGYSHTGLPTTSPCPECGNIPAPNR